ncbi:ABC transporter ATP-binding protein [Cryptosporangium sp. NPDC051539]|uniref:ABC transporter ATP-binding protein n=1 Tax=Cryptosporangium sp. NPDC051539 TaxID=3363962 RepID=UPI0037BBC5C0
MIPSIVVTGLRKSFGDHVVLNDVDLTVPQGGVFALLGPNGAGKTTMVRILSTQRAPDGGSVRVLGHDLRTQADAIRATIGVTGQFSAVDDMLTGAENLRLMGRLHHLSRAERQRRAAGLLERFELTEAAGRLPSTYSGGMRRRLDLAMTLMGRPRLIFLDEPTTGLDPRSRHTTWEIVRELVRDGVTVFLTTQYLGEADRLADRIAVLDGGRVVAEGTADELKRRVPGAHLVLRFASPADLARAAADLPEGSRDDDALELRVPGAPDVVRRLTVPLDDLTVHRPDLDDVFFALTGGGAAR